MKLDLFLDLLSTDDYRSIIAALCAVEPSVTPYSSKRWVEALMREKPPGWELAAIAIAATDDLCLSINPAIQVVKTIVDRCGFLVL